MDNKFYSKIKNNMKDYIIMGLIVLIVISLFTIKLPWSIYAPGGLVDIGKRINTEETIESHYYLTYVSFIEGTIPTLALAYIMPSWDIISNEEITLPDEELKDVNKRDKIYLQESVSNAIYVAYEANNYKINIVGRHGYVTFVFDKENTNFEIGDEILEYDGNIFTNFEKMNDYLKTKSVGETVKYKIVRNDLVKEIEVKIRNIEGEAKLGIGLAIVYDYDNTPNLTYDSKPSESGSSGGLMMALTMYDILADEDLARGRKISGTGTISRDGTVGEISGVKYKLAGAVKNKADIFIAPTKNYKEALLLKQQNKYDIEIIEAKNFKQVLNALRNY